MCVSVLFGDEVVDAALLINSCIFGLVAAAWLICGSVGFESASINDLTHVSRSFIVDKVSIDEMLEDITAIRIARIDEVVEPPRLRCSTAGSSRELCGRALRSE